MAQIAVLKPCVCGKPGIRREIEFEGDVVALMSCDECLDISNKFLDRVRPVFNAMLAVGVPRDIASETMTFLLDKIPDDSMLLTTPLDIMRKVNERGEVGYAEPLPNSKVRSDWDAFQECIDRGWLIWAYDASPDIFSKYHGQKRTVYRITAAGRTALLQ